MFGQIFQQIFHKSRYSYDSYGNFVPHQSYKEFVACTLQSFLKGKQGTVIPQPKLDNGNGLFKHPSFVAQLYVEQQKIDFVFVTCTIPYFISRFDFNDVYYDGYTVHEFDWNALATKSSASYYQSPKIYWQHTQNFETWFLILMKDDLGDRYMSD